LRKELLFFFFLFAMLQLWAAQDPVEQILVRTGEVYKSGNTYQFSGVILYNWKSQDSKSQIFQESFQSFRGYGGKLRYQRGLGMSKILALTDGIASLLYLADKQQYQKSNTPDLEALVRTSLGIENASRVFPSVALLEKYGNLRERFHNARLLGDQDLILDGKKLSCMVLEGIMDPTDIDAVVGNRETRLWIERDRYIIRREISIGTSIENASKGERLQETITFNIAKVNETLPENLFAIYPPQGAAEVKHLFAPETRSMSREQASSENPAFPFYYELPFVAMRNFTLPCAGGGQLSLSQFRGKFVLLDFWATWCVPCHKQRSDLEKVLRKYKGSDLVVLGLNNESMETTEAFIKKHSPIYPLLVDTRGSLASLYRANILPTLVLLDRSGRIVFKREGRLTYEQIEQLLKEAGL
jgi:peroxiredoxin